MVTTERRFRKVQYCKARAVWFESARLIKVREEELANPSQDQILVGALFSAISHGTEMLVYRGDLPKGFIPELPTLAGKYPFPVKFGYASVGRVLERGENVTKLDVGDSVLALHPHQDLYLLPESLATKIPSKVKPEQALFIPNLETALNVLLDASPNLGETVLVTGQGVIGLLITQLLTRLGLERLIVADPIAQRRKFSIELGADVALDPNATVLEREVRRVTNGRGADVSIEASGSPAALQQVINSTAENGTLVICSWYGAKSVPLALGGQFHRGRLTMKASQVSHLEAPVWPRWDHQRRIEFILSLLPSLYLSELISHQFPLSRAADAYRLIDEKPEETVQVIFRYS